MRSIRFILFPILFQIFCLNTWAADFEIRKFDVKLHANEDGSIDVTETIDVHFFEDRRGIFRMIPFKYVVREVNGEVAKGFGPPGSTFSTPIEGIIAEGQEFVVTEEGAFKKLRIGSADIFVTGDQQYVIRYKVYKAISFFSDHAEIYWNFTGNGWDQNIQEVTFSIELPNSAHIGEKDVKLFTGPDGSTESNASWSYSNKTIRGKSTQMLPPKNGITGVFRLPSNIFKPKPVPILLLASYHSFDNFHADFLLKKDGTMYVTESFSISINPTKFIDSDKEVHRDYSSEHHSGFDLVDHANAESIEYEFQEIKRTILDVTTIPSYTWYRSGTIRSLDMEKLGIMSPWENHYEISYKVWNSVKKHKEGHQVLVWKLFGQGLREPSQKISANIRLEEGLVVDSSSFFSDGILNQTIWEKTDEGWSLKYDDVLMPYNKLGFILSFPKDEIPFNPPPVRLFADHYYLAPYTVNLNINTDGWVDFKADFDLHPITPESYINISIEVPETYMDWDDSALANYENQFPKYRLFGNQRTILNRNLQHSPKSEWIYDNSRSKEINWNYYHDGDSITVKKFNYGFSAWGWIKEIENNKYRLHIPVITAPDEPIENIRINLDFDQFPDEYDLKLLVVTNKDTLSLSRVIIEKDENGLIINPNTSLEYFERLHLIVEFSDNAITSNAPLELLTILWKNNSILIFPFILLILLTGIWFVWGRDKKALMMVRFFPPQDLSSAEAGFLIDDKLNKGDIFSLIFDWCGKGYIQIRETTKKDQRRDITFILKERIPDTSKEFEKTLFNRIFPSGRTKRKLSSLKYSTYSDIKKSQNELLKSIKEEKLYVTGSRGFGKFLKFLAWITLPVSLIATGYIFFDPGWDMVGRWDIPIGIGVSNILLFAFARIMPKKSLTGHEKFEELMGFREFIDKAEKEKLEALLKEDPTYFGRTLAFAMAFGMANKWVKKFEGLLENPPEWYGSSNSSNWNPSLFMSDIQSDLTLMRKTMTAEPKPSGGGSSYSSSGYSSFSSSSSYSSSSSSSGGSGFSSGGGSSGGGFGGGGGGSW